MQLDSAKAQERQAEAALQQAKVNLDHTRILAPVDATVIARRMDVGQTVASTLNPPHNIRNRAGPHENAG